MSILLCIAASHSFRHAAVDPRPNSVLLVAWRPAPFRRSPASARRTPYRASFGSFGSGPWARVLILRDGSAEGQPACGKCIKASGLIYRSQSVRTETRHLVTAPPRIALLNGDKPARVNPRPGRRLDRRTNLEAKLRRSLIVARQHAIGERDKMLKDT